MRRLGLACLCLCACTFEHLDVSGGGEIDASIDAPIPIADGAVDARIVDGAVIDGAAIDVITIDAAPDDARPTDACVALPAELCNGVDDTCDGMVDEGLGLGSACDGSDSDLCLDDLTICDSLTLGTTCSDGDDDVETCNGVDDDCDGSTDEGFTGLGTMCDGADTDLCNEGVIVCNVPGTGTECSDATGNNVEACNGVDDDCDGSTDEGFTGLGNVCDGPDLDLCNEGAVICNAAGTGTECTDTSGDNVETCNSLDDDCDGSTDEGFMVGSPCDGADLDLCLEGTFSCDGSGGVACSDSTTTSVETCNSLDDDCDGSTDEDFDLTSDEANCGACGTVCLLTNASSNTCTASTCVPVCSSGSNNCDGSGANGCELRNTNPSCAAPTPPPDLGDVSGDDATAVDTITTNGYTETIVQARVTENIMGFGAPLTVRVDLASPAGVNFDLTVHCATCGGAASQSSALGAGMTDTVFLGRDDASGDRSFDIYIVITWVSSSACGNWTLTIDGAVATTNRTCN